MTDQCKNSSFRGDIEKCLSTPCFQHESWRALQHKERYEALLLQNAELRGFIEGVADTADAHGINGVFASITKFLSKYQLPTNEYQIGIKAQNPSCFKEQLGVEACNNGCPVSD